LLIVFAGELLDALRNRERVGLASGRFAMIDNGLGLQLIPLPRDPDRNL
jgi:hypothetical protein